ncbi:MAG: hypothetical protein KKC46_21305 [Proteobacteria bacterium]|nr:hypothetical protein [Pseudomonadota bacterium]
MDKIRIKIDHSKCTGCRHCETACSSNHYENLVNPALSRIRVYIDEAANQFFPVIAGPFTEAECTCKYDVIIDGKEFDECAVCRASCPRRTWFREPDTGVALKCDLCGEPADPHCVQICNHGALSIVEA